MPLSFSYTGSENIKEVGGKGNFSERMRSMKAKKKITKEKVLFLSAIAQTRPREMTCRPAVFENRKKKNDSAQPQAADRTMISMISGAGKNSNIL